jgi:hypothetical protein
MIFVFGQRGVRHITVNQHDMVICIRYLSKITVALFGSFWLETLATALVDSESGLLTRVAMTESVSLCVRLKS